MEKARRPAKWTETQAQPTLATLKMVLGLQGACATLKVVVGFSGRATGGRGVAREIYRRGTSEGSRLCAKHENRGHIPADSPRTRRAAEVSTTNATTVRQTDVHLRKTAALTAGIHPPTDGKTARNTRLVRDLEKNARSGDTKSGRRTDATEHLRQNPSLRQTAQPSATSAGHNTSSYAIHPPNRR
jgi:hypothetical protein